MQTLDELVRELLDQYAEKDDQGRPLPGKPGAGLMTRLDDHALRTSQPASAGGHAPPSSKPPGSLDAVHWSVRIKSEAIVLDMELRASSRPQTWEKAMRGIPHNAEAADRLRQTSSAVGAWHGTALTVLGLRSPSVYFAHVRCLACGQRTIYGRADGDKPRAWCTNDACEDEETGHPARYDGNRLYLLTTNVAS